MSLPRSLGPFGALLLVAACAAEGSPPPRATPPPRPAPTGPAAEPALLGPARYLYVDRLGSFFDEAGAASSLPRPEPALLDGTRVLLEGGLASAHASAPEKLMGFRSLPERLGGGYVLWSDTRTYRARDFLGELTPITDTGSPGGVRPYLRSFLLRTAVGTIEVDPTTLAAHRVPTPGLAEALALDDQRALRLDMLGRASLSTDGGAHFSDLLRERGQGFGTLREGPLGALILGTPSVGPSLRLGPEGPLAPLRDTSSKLAGLLGDVPTSLPDLAPALGTSRSLPGEALAHALVAGALLRGAPGPCSEPTDLCPGPSRPRFLVARERGLRLFSADTAQPIDDADLQGLDEKFARCQPWSPEGPLPRAAHSLSAASPEPPLLACTGEAGSALLSLPESLARPRLQMTFPDPGRYLAGPHGRFAFAGRCGPQPASPEGLGRALTRPPGSAEEDPQSAAPGGTTSPPSEEPSQAEPAPSDTTPLDARVCLRIDADHWIERRAEGPEIARFYRWIPGEGSKVTALFLGKKDEKSEATVTGEGVRVVRLDPDDPALGGGLFPALPEPQRAPPYRSIDEDFWEDDDGALRGWLRLPVEGDTPSPRDPASPALPLEARRGGRSAGLRIDPRGTVEVFALPAAVTQVVSGGRFALAMAVDEGRERYHQSTDGGRSWTPVEAPPVGRIEPPSDDAAPFGCSAIGCALGNGVLRLGWGGPPPPPAAPIAEPVFTPAANALIRGPRPLRLTCHFDSVGELVDGAARTPSKRPPAPRVVRSPVSTLAPPPGKAPARGKKPRPTPVPARDLPSSPAPPISLHLDAGSPLGALHDQTWTAEVWPPFQPQAALHRLSVRERALVASTGSIVPVLTASAAEPIDLLLQLGKHRLRAAEGRSFQPIDARAQATLAAETPEGALLLLDPDKGLLWLARGESQSAVLRLNRVPDVARTRFTLARRLDGSGLSLIGYSTSTGEVFAGDIDLARAEIGPLTALGRLDTLADTDAPACARGPLSYRFLVELPTRLSLRGKADRSLAERELPATLLIEGNGEQLCLRGLEAALARGREGELSARFGKGGAAALRRAADKAGGSCALAPK